MLWEPKAEQASMENKYWKYTQKVNIKMNGVNG